MWRFLYKLKKWIDLEESNYVPVAFIIHHPHKYSNYFYMYRISNNCTRNREDIVDHKNFNSMSLSALHRSSLTCMTSGVFIEL